MLKIKTANEWVKKNCTTTETISYTIGYIYIDESIVPRHQDLYFVKEVIVGNSSPKYYAMKPKNVEESMMNWLIDHTVPSMLNWEHQECEVIDE